MIRSNSLGNRLIALMLSIVMVLGMLPVNAIAWELTAVAQIGDDTFDTLEDAIAAVHTGANQAAPAEATTIKLLRNTEYAFDVGTSDGSTTMNLKLDLNGNTLTLSPSVGSVGTKTNGIRVLAYSKLEIVNGTIVCSSEPADNVKVGIANYGQLVLDNVQLQAGAQTLYTVNNRGALTLKGSTAITSGPSSIAAVTNDPYNLYYNSAVNASVTCESSNVAVESMLIERYDRSSANDGVVELNISAGSFGKIVEDGNSAVGTDYEITGGVIGVSSAEELELVLSMISAGAEYSCPENPVTIKLHSNMEGSFNVGTSDGKAPKNVRLDLNGKTLTLKPGIGSDGTEVNGIRVLAYSELEIVNGKIVCSDLAEDKVKVGIANYSKLTLDNVQLLAGAQTLYTVNNRGALTLKGSTAITSGPSSIAAVTNDPYNLYYTSNVDASLTCDSNSVSVDSILVERYERNSANQGGVKLDISAGYFGEIKEDGASSVPADYALTGGSYGSDISNFCDGEYEVAQDGEGNFIVKSKQADFGFAQDSYEVTYGQPFSASVQNAVGEVTYSVVAGADVAQVNALTGELTILKAGTVQVKAVAAGNAQYSAAEDTYTLVIHPAYAEVHSFSGGTVTGSGTRDTVVSIDSAVLEWVAKDESIGRVQDGWWVGIKIVAPEGVDLSKAVYQRRSGGTYDGAEVKPFVPESDRYMGMWGLITAEYLESFSNSGKKLNYVWRFSWDGDDVYEQTIAITIDPAGITLNQSGFAFDVTEDATTYGADYFARVPSGGQASKVTYSVSDTTIAEIDPDTGKLTVKKSGEVIITATLSGNYYESTTASYKLTINRAEQSNFGFANSEVTVVYDENNKEYTQAVDGAMGSGALVYEIVSETYDNAAADVAEIDPDTGKLTIHHSGVVVVRATKLGDDCYEAAGYKEYTLTIKKAAQPDFGFAVGSATVQYNDSYTVVATGALSEGTVSYQVTSGDAATVTTVDGKGEITTLKPGTVEITATQPADKKYEEATKTFVLIIEKDDQEYSFAETVANLKYGTLSYTNVLNEQAHISGNAPEYTISDNDIGATVDSQTGEVTFGVSNGKVGTATVTVTVAGNEYYEAFTASYTINVSYLGTTAVPTVTGDSKNSSGWYTGNVKIHAPAGYEIAYSNALDAAWDAEVSFDKEGINDATVYLKHADGITDGIAVEDIMLDTVAADNISITYRTPIIEAIKAGLSFGAYKAKVEVTVTARDVSSGVDHVVLTYTKTTESSIINKDSFTVNVDAVLSDANANTYTATYTLDANADGYFTAVVVDKAGNESNPVADDTRRVVDGEHPGVDVVYTFESGLSRNENNIIYTQGDATVCVMIEEANFSLSNAPIVTVNDVEKMVSWSRVNNTDTWKAEFTLSGDGDYKVKVTFTDVADNEMAPFEQEIRIDSEASIISVTYNDVTALNGNCYKDTRVATITVVEHNFKADEFNLEVIAEDILGDDVTGAYEIGQWTHTGDVHTLQITFTGDAIYNFGGSYTDLAGNVVLFAEPEFLVDKTPADANKIKITYSDSVIGKIIETLSFGFYKANVVVTVTAEDMVSGVDYFELTYTRDPEATDAHEDDFTVTLDAQPGADAKTFTASYTVSAQARGSYSVKVFDRAGKDSFADDHGSVIVTDTVGSNIKVEYTKLENEKGFRDDGNNIVAAEDATKFYYNKNVTAKITIDEANFFEGKKLDTNDVVHQVILKVTRTDDDGKISVKEYLCEGAAQTVVGAQKEIIQWTTVGDTHTVEISFTDNGDYVLELSYQDFSGNDVTITGTDGNDGDISYVSRTITVDKVAPEISVSYNDVTALNGNCYKDTRVATITVKEHNFVADQFALNVIAKDIFGDDVVGAYEVGNWANNGNTHTLQVTFKGDAIYTLDGSCVDMAGNKTTFAEPEFLVDKSPADADKIKIEYSESVVGKVIEALSFGFYKAEAVVTVTAEDTVSGVDYFVLTYTRDPEATDAHTDDFTVELDAQPGADAKTFTASYTVPAQARGSYSVKVFNRAGKDSQANDHGSVIVTDTVESKIKVEYTELENANGFRDANNNVVAAKDATKFYYNKNVTAKITIEEANFFEGKKLDTNGVVHQVILKVTRTDDDGKISVKEYLCAGAAQTVVGAQKEIIQWTTVGDTHTVEISFADNGDYVLELSYQDFSGNNAPINGTDGNSGNTTYKSRTITVDKAAPEISVSYNDVTALNGNCYKDTRVATITVEEHNFKAEEFNVNVTAKDIFGNDVAVMDYAAYAKDPKNWSRNGNVNTLELTFSDDALYTLGGSYTDLAGNSDSFEEPAFVVDHTAASNIQITYSESVIGKVIETLTFGFYKAEVVVTVTAEDMTSGVDYFELTYTRDPEATDAHKDDFTVTLDAQPGADAKTFTASYTVPAQARGSYSVKVFDRAGNEAQADDHDSMIVTDTVSSNIKVEYTKLENAKGFRDANNNVVSSGAAAKLYYNKNVTAKITIEEANFFEGKKLDTNGIVHQVILKVTKTDDNGKVTVKEYLCAGAAQTVAGAQLETIQWTTVGDTHTVEIAFTEDGDYVLELSYQDFSGNDAVANGTDGNSGNTTYTSRTITVDKTAPVISISYNDVTALNGNCYKDTRVATITVVEHNFKAEEFDVAVTARDIFNKTVAVMDYAAYAKDPANWVSNGNTHTLNLTFSTDAIYTFSGSYTDLAGNSDSFEEPEFVVDHTAASNIKITYSTPFFSKIIEALSFGFYKADVVVTVTAEDMVSGVDYFVLTYTRDKNASAAHTADFTTTLEAQPGADAKTFTASYTVPAQARGSYSVEVLDRAGNDSQANDHGSVIVTDTVSSNVKVEYTELAYANGFRDADNNIVTPEEAAKFYYNKNVTAKITIEEANFFEGMKSGASSDGIVHQVILKVTKTDDNGNVTVKEYLCAGAAQAVAGAQKEIIQWTTVGDTHTVEISFADNGDYVLELSYQDFSGNNAPISGTDGNSGNTTYKSRIITVDKAAPVISVSYNDVTALNGNCYKDTRVATITVEEHNFKAEEFNVNVTAKDIFGSDVAVMDYAAYAKDPKNWSRKGNVNTLKLTFSDDAIYTFSGSYTDLAGNSDSFEEPAFVVDHTAASNIQITYSTPIFSTIIEKLTFGFYKADVVVTVTAEDMTSGVDYFELTYTRDKNATDAHTADFMQTLEAQKGADAKTFTASYTVPAQARGSYSVKVFDRAGNMSQTNDHGAVIVTDTVDSKTKVEYAAKDPATKLSFLDGNRKNVATFEESVNAFFDGDVVATITIDEANFFEGKRLGENDVVHQVILKVTKTDDNGVVTVKEYLCAGAAVTVDGAEAEIIEWTTVGDTHTVSITLADDGDYVLELSYRDFSGNNNQLTGNDGVATSNTYTSKVITIDETAPVVDVTYGNTQVINTIDGRNYFDKVQSAVITVTEHNFRAEDIAAVVTAKNVVDADIAVADFAAQLADERNWKHEGNVHTAEIQYTVDANYTFDIAFEDLAKTPAVFTNAEQNDPNNYKMDLFTVDTTAPKNLEIKYSQNIFNVMLDKLFFGYYNTQMTVEISATDDVSGINYFIYSYLLANNVSSVNAQEENVKIEPAKVDGNRFTATFQIPVKDLNATNQFNGSVKFTAYDRGENSTGMDDVDNVRIIVDSIAPKATITYNAPVQTANNISYYNGNINATIVVNEANFDANYTTVEVTKDGVNYPVNVAWRNDSVDIHTGTFTLTEDGDYIITVRSRDKSNNQMATYTSNQLTLDTAKPTIQVSNIKANSANKDEKYGFEITVSDTNLDVSSLAPALKAVVQKEEGAYVVVDVDLGEAKTVVGGQTYTYTVEDLPEDGYYTLICSVQDMASNSMDEITLEDTQSYGQVQFSINRNGSTFGYGNKFSEELIGKYYIYSVDEDVVIVEVNVDPIEEYKVSLNGDELVEGIDYTTTQTSENGEWSKRTYVMKKALFEAEGEYSIIVSSTDKAETTAFSDVKHLALSFVVDQTAPVLTITGLEAGGRYQTDAQTVTLIPTDEGGRLNGLSVVVLDSNGNAIKDATGADVSVRFEMSGEELLKYLEENDGKVTFTVPEGLNNQVRIVCSDCAVNAENEVNEYNELFERVTVSQSQFVIFYANTPLFLGSIAGVLALSALIVFLIKRKSRK